MNTVPSSGGLLILEPSVAWRRTPSLAKQSLNDDKIIATHWYDRASCEKEMIASPLPGHYTVVVPLEAGEVSCWVDKKLVHQGISNSGALCVTPPGAETRCFWSKYSVECVHLFIPEAMIQKAYEDLHGAEAPSDLALHIERSEYDPVFCQIASLAVAMAQDPSPVMQLQADNLAVVALNRLLTTHTEVVPKNAVAPTLKSWRLRAAVDYLQDNLDGQITLADLASKAGLSPMHFAMQFRKATGLSPHKFIIRARLGRAQELMRNTKLPLAHIAVDVGFSSQTHFTTAFKSSIGETPARWRQAIG